jgi:hypothetical protein
VTFFRRAQVSAATVINGDQRSRSPKSRAPFRERRCRVKVTVNDAVEEALKRAEFYGVLALKLFAPGLAFLAIKRPTIAKRTNIYKVCTW